MAEPQSEAEGAGHRGVFSYPSFRRLWSASLVSSFGDWIGFFAVLALTARVSKGSGETAIAFVLSARLLPGFFLGPIIGVLLDRRDRRTVMLLCDGLRAVVFAFLPFVDTVFGLVLASLMLEALGTAWSSAKEATVPNLVPQRLLASANSLSVAAAYGTFPLGGLAFSLFASLSKLLGNIDALSSLRVNQESLALWFDGFTFVISALLVASVSFPKVVRTIAGEATERPNALREMREGLKFIGTSPRVRSVMLGIGAGLFGGGMLVPLGPQFARDDLGGGAAAFGALLTALGFGVAASVIGLSLVQKRLKPEPAFIGSVFAAAAFISLGATSSTLSPALFWVFLLGTSAGAVYVLGFTILQTNVDDALRGRTFATLYTLIRVCVLMSFVVAPVMSRLLASLGDSVGLNSSGVRLSLWTVGGIIAIAGLLALLSLRDSAESHRRHPTSNATTT
ncbi:MAG TPA: MFS transporter [Acidimicrobiales bacterium]|nr:MFS transporter [Acidimicrobiales bacterium]